MIGDRYILEGRRLRPLAPSDGYPPFKVDTRSVASSVIGEIRVETTFLGLDYSAKPNAPRELFETTIWGGPFDGRQHRYATLEEAEAGHAAALDVVARLGDSPA